MTGRTRALTPTQAANAVTLYRFGKTQGEIARLYGVTDRTIRRELARHHKGGKRSRALDDLQRDQAINLYLAGEKLELIAARFAVHYTTICRAVDDSGLARQNRTQRAELRKAMATGAMAV